MLDGFNEGWIDFEYGESNSTKGRIDVETVLRTLMEQSTAE
jgi:NAD(P)H dehydrogenase (quinone)